MSIKRVIICIAFMAVAVNAVALKRRDVEEPWLENGLEEGKHCGAGLNCQLGLFCLPDDDEPTIYTCQENPNF
ncbi:hypothetical protein BDF19DRAFT_434207 [Syncephalis fuscata]|nr:hypothetical protein BDF19DRAFT_434207 [Syncephalis fuscata]